MVNMLAIVFSCCGFYSPTLTPPPRFLFNPFFTAYRVICTFSGICFCDHIICMYKREYEIIISRLVIYIWKLSSVSRFQHVTRPVGFSYNESCGECILRVDIWHRTCPPFYFPTAEIILQSRHWCIYPTFNISLVVVLVQQFGFEYNMCQWSGSTN